MVRHAKAAIQFAANRLMEPSTQAGIAGVSLLVAHNVDNMAVVSACTVVSAACGLAAIIMPEDS